MEESEVDGGVLIVHQLNEGKHQYEVKSVLKHQKKQGEKFFLRRGDKLHLVNETDLQDIPPEELAQILSKGNPMLTVHKTLRKKEPVVMKPSGEDVMVPVSKKEMLLHFGQEMMREDLPGEDNLLPTGGDEDNICTEESGQSEFLVVTMKKTSISVITGRSCDPKQPCHECRVECEYNDIVMVTETSTVTLVPRGGGILRQLKTNEVHVEHSSSSMFMGSLCSQKSVYMSQSPERITIYYYKSDITTKGLPVVLNFTGSDCFLKCCWNGVKAQLQVEICEKQKLKSISKNDKQALAYVFYMKSDPSRNTTFESAAHSGWFIQVSVPDNAEPGVQMVDTAEPQVEKFFYIIIQRQ